MPQPTPFIFFCLLFHNFVDKSDFALLFPKVDFAPHGGLKNPREKWMI